MAAAAAAATVQRQKTILVPIGCTRSGLRTSAFLPPLFFVFQGDEETKSGCCGHALEMVISRLELQGPPPFFFVYLLDAAASVTLQRLMNRLTKLKFSFYPRDKRLLFSADSSLDNYF